MDYFHNFNLGLTWNIFSGLLSNAAYVLSNKGNLNRGIKMRRDGYKVFSQATLAHLTLKNRLVRSATFESAMTKEGRVTGEMLNLYKNLAEGGVGMIITGSMTVVPEGKCHGKVFQKETCIYDDVYVDEIAKIADVVNRSGSGCKIMAQLNHGGRQVLYDNHLAEPVGPSDVPSPLLNKKARALTTEDVEYIIQCFADAIVRVNKAGFDGVQLHSAHGYLLSSFLSPYTNRRSDQYGGSIRNRVNIIKEIVSTARKEVGNFPILVKMNCDDYVEGGINKDTFPELAKEVESLGVDAIEVSGGMWDCLVRTEKELGFFPMPIPEARTRIHGADRQSYFLKYAENLNLTIPVILVGGHRNIEQLEEIIRQGTVDFLGLCRPLISEPDLPNRWLEGRGTEKTDCVSCNSCLLTVKFNTLYCMRKQKRLRQKIVKNLVPHLWKINFK